MQFTGQIQGVTRDWNTDRVHITFSINEESALRELEALKDSKLSIQAAKYRQKRSLDANAYAWVLMQKIAEAADTDKWSVYLRCLQDYSNAFTHVIVKPNAVARMKELYRTFVDLGEVTVNGMTGHQLQVYYGSSTFDTKEMSVFIDGLVRECKDLKIETLPPEELARMKAMWGAK
jgi:hypothetical protein